ncbi:MAG: M20/M25/M40 family metallo-hydrolase [Oscillospiraceae bacterium]|jgi:endoglucanase|nr:M20/M25/M40 family metallo-hydrolase [Oscillospiraceae bacterium]
MLDTLKTLCYLSGPSGWEDEVRDYILERVMPHADKIFTDSMGNLIVTKKGAISGGRRILLCAHMDEVGLIVTAIDGEGFLRFDCLGGIDRRVLIGKRVYIGKDRVHGVIGIKPYHHVGKDEEKNVPKREALYIDIGVKSGDAARELVSPGDPAVFDDSVLEFGEGFLKAKAIDDRIGCAAMIKLIESALPCDCVFAFTVQEEIGARGAKTVSARVRPDTAIILEGTTAADLPGVPEGKRVCALGEGLVIPFMDKGAIYSRGLYKTLTALADAHGIKWQTKTLIAGGTDAQAVQRSGTGVDTIAISAPIRNIHSPASIAKISDFTDMPRLALLLLETLSDEKEVSV